MKNNVLKIIGISFAFLFLVIGACVGIYVAKRPTKIQTVTAETNVVPDGAIFTPRNNAAMKLNVSLGRRNASSGVNNMEYTVTATVQPSGHMVDWSLAWKDENGWASGKALSDYVTLTSNGLTATIKVNKAFGKQVILTCTATLNSSVKATCSIDYAKRIIGVNATWNNGDDEQTITDGGTFTNLIMDSDLSWDEALSYEFIYSDYTIDVPYKFEDIWISESAALQPALNAYNWSSVEDPPTLIGDFWDSVHECEYHLGNLYDFLECENGDVPAHNDILNFYNANPNLVFALGDISFIGTIPGTTRTLSYTFNCSFAFGSTLREYVTEEINLNQTNIIV